MSAARWTTLAELQDRREEWLALLDGSDFPSIFADPRWISSWWRHYGADAELWPLLVEDSSGALRGLATLVCQAGALGRTLSFAGGRWNGFDTPLWAAGAEQEVAEALLGALADRRRDWQLWRIGRLPKDSALARLLLGAEAPLRAGAHDVRLQPFVVLPDDADSFESRYSGKRRTEFRRRWRRLVEQGAEARSIADPAEADAQVRRLLELRRERASALGQPYAHMDERFAQFTAEVVRELLPDAARLWILELDGELLAAKLDFVAAWREHSYISAVSDKQLPLGPGHSLERQAIHAMIAEGRRELDFGPGRDSYKYHWGAVDRELARVVVASPTPRGRLLGAAGALDLRLRNTAAAEALRRRRGVVPERETSEMPARQAQPEPAAASDGG